MKRNSPLILCLYFLLYAFPNLCAQSLEDIRDSIYLLTSSNDIVKVKSPTHQIYLAKEESKTLKYIKYAYEEIQKKKVKDEALEVFFLVRYAQYLREHEGRVEEAYQQMQDLYQRFQSNPALKHKAKDTYGELLMRLGYLFFALEQNLERAEALYIEALDTYIVQDSLYNYTSLLINLSHLHRYKNNFAKARDYALQVQDMRKVYGEEHYIYASALNVLGTVYEYFEQYDVAEEYYRLGIKLLKKNAKEIFTLPSYEDVYFQLQNNLGVLYIYLSRFSEAKNCIEEVKLYDERLGKTKHNLHSNLDYATTCLNLALIYSAEKNFFAAKEYVNRCLEIEGRVLGENSMDYARSLRSLGDIYREEKNFSKSLLTFKKVRTIYEKKQSKTYGESKEYLSTLKGEALLYREWELHKQSLETFKKVLSLQEGMQNQGSHLHISSLQNVALAYANVGNYIEAYKLLESSILLNCKEEMQTVQWQELHTKTWIYPSVVISSLQTYAQTKYKEFQHSKYNKIGLDTAYIAIQQAIAINKQIRNNLWSDNDKLKILEETFRLTNLALDISLALQSEAHLHDVFIFIENNKAALLSEGIRSQQANKFLPKDLSDKETELAASYSRLTRQIFSSISLQEDEYYQKQLVAIQDEIAMLKARLEREYPKYYQWKYASNSIDVSTLQTYLKPSELLLEYFIGADNLFLLAISKKKIKLYHLPLSAERINTELMEFKKRVSRFDLMRSAPHKAYKDYVQGAYDFYVKFLKNSLEDFKGQTELIIIPDGQLGLIPFEIALTSPGSQDNINYKNLNYLLKTHSVAYHYSANLWLEHRVKSEQNILHRGKILGMGGSYSGNHPFLTPLSSVNIELQAINNIYKGEFITDSLSTEATFKEYAPQYDIIHLAMHGLGNERMPFLSSLHFTDKKDRKEDNILEAWEIMQTPIRANLVTLSACESGVGVYLRGDGVSSLARAFMYSGASSLLVSLWKVHDQATAAIMQFYYGALAEGLDKDAALRQAKLRYLDTYDEEILHPAYWGAFVQIGDIANIKPLSNDIWLYVACSAAGIVLISTALFIKKRKLKLA